MLSVRSRIAQGQREEAAGRVEALAGRAQRGQAGPALRLSATGQTHADSSLATTRTCSSSPPTTAVLHTRTYYSDCNLNINR